MGGDPQLAKDSLVLIDDADDQSSYNYYDNQLWSCFKLLEMDSDLFVLFSSYGSPGTYPAEVKDLQTTDILPSATNKPPA